GGGGQLAVGTPARQVVEDVERDADVVRRRAQVGIQVGDVAALGDDEIALLRGLRVRELWHAGKRGRRAGCRDLEHVTSSHLCHVVASSAAYVRDQWGSIWGSFADPVKARVPGYEAGAVSGCAKGERRPRACTSV